MFNQDTVIRYAIEARDAHAYEVGKALDSYIAEQTQDTRAALRIALVAMSLGHEASAHDEQSVSSAMSRTSWIEVRVSTGASETSAGERARGEGELTKRLWKTNPHRADART